MKLLTVREAFEECQKGMQSHGKLVKNLVQTCNARDFEEFYEEFLHHIKFSLIVYQREPVVERTLDFAAKFATFFTKESEKKSSKEKGSDSEEEDMHPFILKFFTFILEHHNAKDKAVRFRCCHMVNKLLNNMTEEAQIDDDLYEKIYECMQQRLRDKFPSIRVQAVLALSRLQDPHDTECPVINAYIFLMSCDSNPDVRRAVLSVIATSVKTLPGILERTRDVKDHVRKTAYQVIAEKVHIRALTIAQRVRLLQEGLTDRSEVVKHACTSRVLQAWLRVYEGNTIELLRVLDVENSADTCQLTLKTFFSKSPVAEILTNFDVLNDDHVLDIEELSCETVLYWRCLAEYIQSCGAEHEELLDRILPSGIVYSDFMTGVLSHMKGEENVDVQLRNEFLLQQLLLLAGVMDLTDEVSRKRVSQVLKDMMLCEDTTHSLMRPVLELYTKLVIDQDQRLRELTELISDIRMPISVVESGVSAERQRQVDLKVAGIRVKLNQLRDELEAAVQSQDFTVAAEVKLQMSELEESKQTLLTEVAPQSQEVRTEKNDPTTILKCLSIAKEMLLQLNFRGLKPALQSLLETLILPGVTNTEPAVRNVAVSCLGLCCLMDKETARTHFLLFIQMSQIDVETVKVSALQIIFDVLLTFGLDAFGVDAEDKENTTDQTEDKPSELNDSGSSDISMTSTATGPNNDQVNRANSILTVLISMLDSESSEVRTNVAEGLAKLMISRRVVSPRLLSRLLLLWYNPVTEDDNQLRHCLGTFFPVYAFAARSNQAVVQEAFMMTLNTLFNAPATSPLAEVNVNNVAELLVQLTCERHLLQNQGNNQTVTQDQCCHDGIAVAVCSEILKEPNSFNVRCLCRVLTLLEPCQQNYTNLKDLKVLAANITKKVKDKQSVKIVEKFEKQVKNLLTAARESGLCTPGPIGTPSSHRATPRHPDTTQQPDDETTVVENPDVTVDVTLLEDGKPDKRKHKKGKKALRSVDSIAETPVSSKDKQVSRTRDSKQSSTSASDLDRGEADNLVSENEIFASPTPVRRSARNRKAKAAGSSSSLATAKKSYEELLPESDVASEEDVSRTTGQSSLKNRRESSNREPLNEKNEAN